MENNNLIPFEGKEIRKAWHLEQWYFSVIDVIEILTDSPNPQVYWGTVKRRENQLIAICKKLKFLAPDGKMRSTDCANTEGIFRIIMSVPSPKAEPLKLWLAEQGKRTLEETENPELLTERQRELYKAKGYTDEWIKNRLAAIQTRKELTSEWQKRGISESKDYSILTAIIAKGTFGMTPTEHKDFKALPPTVKELRDHMTPLELIFTALGEELTRQTTINDNAQGFNENHDAAVKGGKSAGDLRKEAERKGFKVISKENFLPPSKGGKTGELPESPTEPKE
jgi:DNA-damage-inducible protein D